MNSKQSQIWQDKAQSKELNNPELKQELDKIKILDVRKKQEKINSLHEYNMPEGGMMTLMVSTMKTTNHDSENLD